MRKFTVKNSAGEVIRLTNAEQHHAAWVQRQIQDRHSNDLGYEIDITTLTQVVKKISEQKFFELPPADYVPVRVGEGAWMDQLTTYRSFVLADAFETGIINLGGQNARLATADAGVDALNIKVYPWAKEISWSLFELNQASKSGNWDLIAAKEESRKKNWDLGVQKIAFLGADGLNGASGSCFGLLNQVGITANTAVIPQPIKDMDPAELKAFTAALVETYRENCNRTAWPTHFVIPESDYNGLMAQSSPQFPIKSVLDLLEESFKGITRNKNFKILPCAYGDVAYSGFSYQQYALFNYDEKSIRMDIPLDYTNTLANSVNNFQLQNVGYGQFTGVLAYRPLELMYFQYTP